MLHMDIKFCTENVYIYLAVSEEALEQLIREFGQLSGEVINELRGSMYVWNGRNLPCSHTYIPCISREIIKN